MMPNSVRDFIHLIGSTNSDTAININSSLDYMATDFTTHVLPHLNRLLGKIRVLQENGADIGSQAQASISVSVKQCPILMGQSSRGQQINWSTRSLISYNPWTYDHILSFKTRWGLWTNSTAVVNFLQIIKSYMRNGILHLIVIFN